MNISVTDQRNLFTNMLIATYREMHLPKNFFRSFFPTVTAPTKLINIEVSREDENIAVDVLRGTEGNRNSWSRSTQKTFLPPYYHEFFDMTELDLYDALFGSGGTVGESAFADLLSSAQKKIQSLQGKIERAYELQCAQVLLDGIVQLRAGLNIDYNRKAASLVDLGTTTGYWSAAANHDIYKDLQNAAYFLRTEGKAMGAAYNVILGGAALEYFQKNTEVRTRNDIFHIQWDSLKAPQKEATGAATFGSVTAGPYRFNLWSYPEYYKNKAGAKVPYMHDKKIIVMPEETDFKLSFAAVPQLLDLDAGVRPVEGAYLVSEHKDQRKAIHLIDVKSAGLAVPVAVDQIYTAQVVV